jgi:hypothetical protein
MKFNVASLKLNFTKWIAQLNKYIDSLTLYEKLAWGAIFLGLVLIVIALILF